MSKNLSTFINVLSVFLIVTLSGYGAFHISIINFTTQQAALYASAISGITGILLGKWIHILFSRKKYKVVER